MVWHISGLLLVYMCTLLLIQYFRNNVTYPDKGVLEDSNDGAVNGVADVLHRRPSSHDNGVRKVRCPARLLSVNPEKRKLFPCSIQKVVQVELHVATGKEKHSLSNIPSTLYRLPTFLSANSHSTLSCCQSYLRHTMLVGTRLWYVEIIARHHHYRLLIIQCYFFTILSSESIQYFTSTLHKVVCF